MAHSFSMFRYWRDSLSHFLVWFEEIRARSRYFHFKAFSFFVLLNLLCYWGALLTAYPANLTSAKAHEYVLMGFPVAVLGGAFDSLSLLVTIFIVRRALRSQSNSSYVFYLSVDLLIAIVATFWVLFVFMISGWVVSYLLHVPETIGSRVWLYETRVESAMQHPLHRDSLKNIYFGVVMGASALLPTLLHLSLAALSLFRSGWRMVGSVRSDP